METKREWTPIKEYEDILFDYYNGIARITINRERYRNAFTPTTTGEMSDALRICREEPDINVVVLTGAGDKAFCSGGDQNVKGRGGYIGKDGVPRLSVLDVQNKSVRFRNRLLLPLTDLPSEADTCCMSYAISLLLPKMRSSDRQVLV